jgi:hypothetical protein
MLVVIQPYDFDAPFDELYGPSTARKHLSNALALGSEVRQDVHQRIQSRLAEAQSNGMAVHRLVASLESSCEYAFILPRRVRISKADCDNRCFYTSHVSIGDWT